MNVPENADGNFKNQPTQKPDNEIKPHAFVGLVPFLKFHYASYSHSHTIQVFFFKIWCLLFAMASQSQPLQLQSKSNSFMSLPYMRQLIYSLLPPSVCQFTSVPHANRCVWLSISCLKSSATFFARRVIQWVSECVCMDWDWCRRGDIKRQLITSFERWSEFLCCCCCCFWLFAFLLRWCCCCSFPLKNMKR